MTLDMYAGEEHFADHLAPIWAALPPGERGTFFVHPSIAGHAKHIGIEGQVHAVASPPSLVPTTRISTPILTASYGDIKKVRRLGYVHIAFIEHGIGQSYAGAGGAAARHGSYSGGDDRADVGLFLVPNGHAAARWRRAYPRARVEIIGSPKLDTLPAREPGPGPVIALSFHWSFHVAPEITSAYQHYRKALKPLANTYTTIGHAHPRDVGGMTRIFARDKIEMAPEFTEVCRMADVYLADNSSTLFEFASTGRPVVVLNAPAYRREVNHGLRFWNAANVGVQVDHPGDLVAAVTLALSDPPEQRAAREAALDIVYAYRSGAAERAAEALRAWASAPISLPVSTKPVRRHTRAERVDLYRASA